MKAYQIKITHSITVDAEDIGEILGGLDTHLEDIKEDINQFINECDIDIEELIR